MTGQLVTIFGASGFLGRNIVRELAKAGYRIRAAVRRPNEALFLRPMGSVGQVEPFQANVRFPESVRRAVDGADIVINLVGILYESGAQKFDLVQAGGAAEVAKAAADAGVSRLVHVSAIGADPDSPAAYARTKALGEQAVLKAFPSATILRPSIVFGAEDEFFNRFAGLARLLPALPLIGGGETRFQPVYVDDVADAVVRCLEDDATKGKTYELGGPEIFTFRELMEYILETTERNRLLVPLPWSLAKVQAAFLQLLPKPLLTVDQVRLLETDNVVSEEAKADGRTLEGLGLTPRTIEAIVPSYLYRFRRAGQFQTGPAN